MKSFYLVVGILITAAISIAAVQTNHPSVQALTASGSVASGATYTDDFAVPRDQMVSVVLYKTGAGSGLAKLQGSNDGSGWKDINITTYPGASGVVSTGASMVMLSAEAFAWARARLSYTNNLSGGVITGGKWISK